MLLTSEAALNLNKEMCKTQPLPAKTNVSRTWTFALAWQMKFLVSLDREDFGDKKFKNY